MEKKVVLQLKGTDWFVSELLGSEVTFSLIKAKMFDKEDAEYIMDMLSDFVLLAL